jgi:hypothetical protein
MGRNIGRYVGADLRFAVLNVPPHGDTEGLGIGLEAALP